MLRILKRPWIIAVLGVLAVLAFLFYAASRAPADMELKGPEATAAWLSLGTGVVSLLTSLVGLLLKLLDLRNAKKD